MERFISKNGDSREWEKRVNPNNSEWLAENIKKMGHGVERLLNLIEEDGVSFANNDEMYYLRRPELISLVDELNRMHCSLADRYDLIIGKLQKTISSKLQGQGNDSSSSSTESDSESEDGQSKNHLLSLVQNGNDDVHHSICELKKVIDVLREKLQDHEKGFTCNENETKSYLEAKIANLEEELFQAKDKLGASEKMNSDLKVKLKEKQSILVGRESLLEEKDFIEATLKSEREKTSELQEQILAMGKEATYMQQTIQQLKLEFSASNESFSLGKATMQDELQGLVESKELELQLEKTKVSELHQRTEEFETSNSYYKSMVADLKAEIFEATGNFLNEKLQLQGQISGLMDSHKSQEAKFTCLEDEFTRHKLEKTEIASALEKLRSENNQKTKQLETLQGDYDALRKNNNSLVATKYELSAKLLSLLADLSSRDDQIKQLNGQSHQLQREQKKLIQQLGEAKQASQELATRVEYLDVEINKQKDLMSELAEGKREAIRQLCFSIEHHRDRYDKILQTLHARKQRVLAS